MFEGARRAFVLTVRWRKADPASVLAPGAYDLDTLNRNFDQRYNDFWDFFNPFFSYFPQE